MRRNVHIAVVTPEDTLSSAVTGLSDALGIANLRLGMESGASGFFELSCYSATGRSVQGTGGFMLSAAGAWHEVAGVDVVVVPPLFGDIQGALSRDTALVELLRGWAERSCLVTAVCTGTFYLAEAGLLRGRRTTTNPGYAGLFRQRYPDIALVVEQRLIDEGTVITAGASTSYFDLALHLIGRFAGQSLAVQCAKGLGMDRNRPTQKPYAVQPPARNPDDVVIADLQDWIDVNFAQPLTVDAIAEQAAMSVRTLNRRFRRATGLSPLDYVHYVRIEAAKRLLETTDTPVQRVTSSVGYADPRSFSRLFRRFAGVAPREYRQRYGPEAA